MTTVEVNFDGLVGPTHNYGGLSFGNKASSGNANAAANPRLAAQQGLAKMRAMLDLGLVQGVLPPHARPHGPTLAKLGFSSDSAAGLAALAAAAPELAPQLSSASAMWAANAATIAPSSDSADGRLHLTAANLVANTHRSIEGEQTATTLGAIFADSEHFAVHQPLPATAAFGDEGAANHSRLANSHDASGVHVFVYGRDASERSLAGGRFPRRQTKQACEAIARLHGLDADRVRLVRQSARAIDAGAFHNDVVSVVNERVVLCHHDAYDDDTLGPTPAKSDVERFVRSWSNDSDGHSHIEVVPVVIDRSDVSLDDAVSSYLFNSQLVTIPGGSMALITPAEVDENEATRTAVARIVDDTTNPITEARSFDLRQSMRNGGGPACLRLRVVMSETERAAVTGRVIVDHRVLDELGDWVDRHYRTELNAQDLLDPALATESMAALDELTQLLDIGPIYPFQH